MQQLTIVKIGGNVIDDEKALSVFLEEFSVLKGKKILVHGGGKLANQLQEKLGVAINLIDGRRITDEETLKIVTMVYAGLINKNLVSKLQSLNCNAIGLSGADANCILANKRNKDEIDYGFVGDIKKVNASFISSCLENNLTPVFSAITHDGHGQLLNTNADTIASELAIALSNNHQVQLVYCFEKNGVLKNVEDDNSLIKTISNSEYLILKEELIINKGMIPKMDNAFNALNKGVKFIQIGNANRLSKLLIEENYEGTRLYN
ncbi:acetylglutamate kinase [Sediminibacterium sp.]|uniref:acetylglutamate kinase n=1 Tax=Sediminibacterium sp. TaxID=1917865 RepID=UPI002732DF96|nr:acetylglutamate kinase [Sediminibacterium sp.]MDP3567373.1 acetylglutamate kinase [Sediminibacterium sp.]